MCRHSHLDRFKAVRETPNRALHRVIAVAGSASRSAPTRCAYRSMNAMWFKNIFNRNSATAAQPLFDEAFLRRLERLSLQAQRTLRGQPSGGEHLSRHQLPATIFNDHRPYSAGDDYRYVDWNAYAHQEEIFVRLGEIEQSIGVHLLLDISRSMAFPAAPPKRLGLPSKIHSAKRLIAAL